MLPDGYMDSSLQKISVRHFASAMNHPAEQGVEDISVAGSSGRRQTEKMGFSLYTLLATSVMYHGIDLRCGGHLCVREGGKREDRGFCHTLLSPPHPGVCHSSLMLEPHCKPEVLQTVLPRGTGEGELDGLNFRSPAPPGDSWNQESNMINFNTIFRLSLSDMSRDPSESWGGGHSITLPVEAQKAFVRNQSDLGPH